MIKYKIDVMKALRDAGYTANKMRADKILGESTMQRLRDKKDINTKTLNIICILLDCQPSDILEVVASSEEKENLKITQKCVDNHPKVC